jgi:GMP synthase - Glutamine amidotransferase domain
MYLSKAKRIHIIKTGKTYECINSRFGDFDDMITQKLGIPTENIAVWPIYEKDMLPAVEDISAVIITGSHSMVTDNEVWSIKLGEWLRKLSELSIPILGICYGHQLLAQAFGGVVNYHPKGPEFGTVNIYTTVEGKKDPLLGAMPDIFPGHAAHSQSIIQLPDDAVVLARNEFENNHAFVINKNIWGVQFHPEFNSGIIKAYIDSASDRLKQLGYDVEALKKNVVDSDVGTKLLRRFIELI